MSLQLVYDHDCTLCKLHQTTEDVCEGGHGPANASIIVVSKMPNSETYQAMIEQALVGVGLDLGDIFFTSAVKCRTFDQDASNKDVKICRTYMDGEIAAIKPKWILAFGNEALLSLTGNSGITKYRGKIYDKGSYKIIPTISPASVMRNPGQMGGWVADLQYFASQVLGRTDSTPTPKIAIVDTKKKLQILAKKMDKADLISYDIETTCASEFEPIARIVSLAGTMITGDQQLVFTIPLYHPDSPFRTKWRAVLRYLAPHFERIPKQVAHNGKFDARWLRHFGIKAIVTFDTMLAAHLLDENRAKGLKPLARTLLGVPPWDINTRTLLETRLNDVLKYNALDTFYTYQIYLIFKQQLIEQPRLLRLYTKLIIPANEILIDAEREGVWLDPEKLASANKIAFDMRDEIDRQLAEWLPERDSDDWPTNAKGKPLEVNFNPSNFARWFLFEHLEMPIIARGKTKEDGSPGNPSMAEDVMLELRALQHPVIELLLDRAKWQKYCSTYVSSYMELRDEESRIRTTFKLAGTVTGRLSSGKADAEKVTGRAPIRGVNLQQVPRDDFIRGLFGAPPGWAFVEADFSQVELRVIAYVSRDRTMRGIYQRGEDIHLATAASVLGKPMSQVSKDDRKKAKAVNFGFAYGMGAKKFVQTALSNYGAVFTFEEAQEVRKAFFNQFSGLLPWHNRQRRLVREHGRVQSPLGRIRHLPDIYSGESGVQHEAERQAINSPIQSMASDMNILSMILIHAEFQRQGIRAKILGTVHDAINFEVWEPDVGRALPVIKDTMENLPLKRKFGVDIDIPIVSDLKVGSHWGGARELEPDEVYNWKG